MPGPKPGSIPSGCPLMVALILLVIKAVRKVASR